MWVIALPRSARAYLMERNLQAGARNASVEEVSLLDHTGPIPLALSLRALSLKQKVPASPHFLSLAIGSPSGSFFKKVRRCQLLAGRRTFS